MGPQNNGLYNQPSLAGLQQQPQMHQVHQIPANGLLDSLYESRLDDRHLDDRHFVPDGMVPGLRPSVPVRGGRDMYVEGLDEMQINARLAAQQRGPPEQLYPNQMPMFTPRFPGVGRGNPANQQQTFRGGPSPINLQGMGQQRLPPGLANLGGRPPHDPSQFMNPSMGMGPGSIHGQINGNLPSQQAQFNGFNGSGGMGGFAGGPQIRGGPIPGPHQIQNQNSASGLAHLGGIDPRISTQAQLLAMGLRGGAGANFGGPPQGLGGQLQPGQMQPSMANLRQQPNGPPHPMAHMIPPHMQQQQPQPGGANNQQAQELMALLMGGNMRE
jgi:zinc finger CCCH domain-containing protein 13